MRTWQNALADRAKSRKKFSTMSVSFGQMVEARMSANGTLHRPFSTEITTQDPIAISPAKSGSHTDQNPWVIRKIWLGALANPSGFVSALKHTASQWLGISADQVSFMCNVLSKPDCFHSVGNSELSIVVVGLFVENGYWNSDTGLICPPLQNQHVGNLPPVLLQAKSTVALQTVDKNVYNIPLFLSFPRCGDEEAITKLLLPCQLPNQLWSSDNVALVVAVPDDIGVRTFQEMLLS